MDEILKYLEESIEGLLRRIKTLESQDPLYPPVQVGIADANLVLTNIQQSISGTSITLDPGNYIVFGTFHVVGDDATQQLEGGLLVDSTLQTALAKCNLDTINVHTVTQIWRIQLTIATTVVLRARKTGGAGTSTVYLGNTSLVALETK